MNKVGLTVLSNEALTQDVFRMTLSGDTSAVTAPGQFVNLALDGFFLRRPISVCDIENGKLTIIYKCVGKGTEYMASLLPGAVIDTLMGLGNGYSLNADFSNPVLVGGGVGVPPLYLLAKRLIENGKTPCVVLGFNTASEVFYMDEFEALGCKTLLTTVDGSLGIKGFVTDAIDECSFDYVFSCGPEPMLKAVYNKTSCSGQYSFEERMGCGFGACMGCSCETKYGSKRICTDGPVLTKEEIIW